MILDDQFELNWAELDKLKKYSYRQDRLELAHKMGFDYISESIAKIYAQLQSCIKTAHLLEFSDSGINNELRRMGIKLAPRGGRRLPKGKRFTECEKDPTFHDLLIKRGGWVCPDCGKGSKKGV
jgi:hypothetical protein